MEENFISHGMEKAKTLSDLTAMLRRQYKGGSTVTVSIVKLCDGSDGKQLAQVATRAA
jgi:hypothetical protein